MSWKLELKIYIYVYINKKIEDLQKNHYTLTPILLKNNISKSVLIYMKY
jgi:hypothetical protein